MPAGFGHPSSWKDTLLISEGKKGYLGQSKSLLAYSASDSSPEQMLWETVPEWCQVTAVSPWHGSLADTCTSAGAARDIVGFVLLHNSTKAELQAVEW